MKNYSKDVISKLQQSIDEGHIEIKKISNENELPKTIYLDGVKMQFTKNGDKHDVTKFLDQGFHSTDDNNWKNSTSLFKYYRKDWKSNNLNIENYLEVVITVGEIIVKGLVRRLEKPLIESAESIEENTELTEENVENIEENSIENQKNEELESFYNDSDLLIENEPYTIIKLYIVEYESYTQNSQLEDRNFENIELDKKDEDSEDGSLQDASDIEESEVLF